MVIDFFNQLFWKRCLDHRVQGKLYGVYVEASRYKGMTHYFSVGVRYLLVESKTYNLYTSITTMGN